MAPRRELKSGAQVDAWLREAAGKVRPGASLTLIGSGALLLHAFRQRSDHAHPPVLSMDIDPITEDQDLALFGYDCMIGSEFEREHGFHVNLMPAQVTREFPEGWEGRSTEVAYGAMKVILPAPEDLMVPKLRRGEPRDLQHLEWAVSVGLISEVDAARLRAEHFKR